MIKSIVVTGERYEAEVPDTLDLAERARFAVENTLTNSGDPEYDYEHGRGVGGFFLTTKFVESLPMMRVMSGSELNLDVEEKMMEALVSHIGEDGLLYCPANTPWRKGGRGYLPTDEDYSAVYANGRMMLAMMAWYQRDHDPVWLDRIKKMAEGLGKIAIYKDDYAYYPDGGVAFDFSYLKKTGWKNTEEPESEHEGAEGTVKFYNTVPVRALARWYSISGDKKALELARKITNFTLKSKFWEKGNPRDVIGPERAQWRGHFHGHTSTIRALLWHAIVTNDQRLKEFARAGYEYARDFGIARIGWFPAWIGPRPVGHKLACESCAVADMIALAIKLSDSGVGDYWEDADGYVRNTLIEQQYINVDLIKKTSTKKIERCLGGFCGAADLTSISGGRGGGSPGTIPADCCTGNATPALYYAWESIVRCGDGVAQVNLLLNRASPWLDVDSYMPYEGKVVIKNKTAKKLSVRIPCWVDKKAVRRSINGKEASPFWLGNYLVFEKLGEKDIVTIEFPIVEETVKYTVPGGLWHRSGPKLRRKQYTLHFKGNTLVDIFPRNQGSMYPTYQRNHYEGKKAPTKKVTRFVSKETIRW